MTFRVGFYVDDKYLGEAFRRLTGIAKNVSYNHVSNLEKTGDIEANGRTKLTAEESLELFVKAMRKIGTSPLKASDARTAIAEIGCAPTSYSYFLQRAVKQGLMKRHGTSTGNMTYTLKKE